VFSTPSPFLLFLELFILFFLFSEPSSSFSNLIGAELYVFAIEGALFEQSKELFGWVLLERFSFSLELFFLIPPTVAPSADVWRFFSPPLSQCLRLWASHSYGLYFFRSFPRSSFFSLSSSLLSADSVFPSFPSPPPFSRHGPAL